MRIPFIAVAILSIAIGCARDDRGGADTTADSAAPTGSTADRARNAAMVANAIAANPARADSILQAAGYTRDSFQQAMYEIAADSAMSAVYAAAKTP
jgi:hypothetical protein